MIVIDASAVLELLLNTEQGTMVGERIRDPAVSLHAPHLLPVEVAQVLRRYVAGGALVADIAADALDDLTLMGINLYDHEPLLGRVWQLRENVTAYDGVYLALAEALDAPLVTFDRRLAAAPSHAATIELLA